MSLLRKRQASPAQVIILGFLGLIGAGTLLLMLPFASREPGSAPFLDALFTATSATCVTGLVVQDTATYWTVFGQGVILLLIQIGGMGVVTMAMAIAMVTGQKIGLKERLFMQESIADTQVGGIVARTYSSGILEGDFTLMEEGKLKLSYLPDGAQLVAGDEVLTSGKGGVFPSGLVVGQIEGVFTEPSGKTRYAVVVPEVDLGSLIEVFVIKDFDIVE